ncbi:hypothetical protein [Flavobacterium beibuense]|uniref:hypothetical protein n=1 Tax=Flavobacterium beibuense TaxID=657326 RepID=UPI003A904AEA
MEQLTTYRAKGNDIGLVFLFKYDLNGNLKLFEIAEGSLNDDQMKWLFSGNFPATEALMKANWLELAKFKKVFKIEVSPPDLSFDALWVLHDHKVAKAMALKAFKKLKAADLIPCFLGNARYQKYHATKPNLEKMHLSTFINQRRWEDEYTTDEPKKEFSRNYNPMLGDLATKKRER